MLVHMYQEIGQPYALLYNLVPALKPDARVGIVDAYKPTSFPDDDRHGQAEQFGYKTRQALELIVGIAVFDRDVLAFGEPTRCQTLTEARDHGRGRHKRRAAQKPDHRHRRLFGARTTAGNAAAPPSTIMIMRRFIQ
jgi:hypothetical protein